MEVAAPAGHYRVRMVLEEQDAKLTVTTAPWPVILLIT